MGTTQNTVNPGEQHELKIVDIASNGCGVARLNGLAVFIPFTAVDDRVQCKITRSAKNYCEAELLSIIEPGPTRTQPPCEYFHRCGGCQYQHLQYTEQLRIKEKQIRDTLRKVAKEEVPPLLPIIASPQSYHYRNKITVHSDGKNIGFYAYNSRQVVDIQDCDIALEEINHQLQVVRNRKWQKDESLTLKLEGTRPGSMFGQVNEHANPLLLEKVESLLSRGADRSQWMLVDAYSGAGFFTIPLSKRYQKVVGIEADSTAVAMGQAQVQQQNLANVEFVAAPVEKKLGAILARHAPNKTALLMDPPRIGCEPAALTALLKRAPMELVYISCNPSAFARDWIQLKSAYRMQSAQPLDLFPQTIHCELIVHAVRV